MNRSILALAIVLATFCSFVQAGAVEQYNLDKSRLALQGYDPVSYFDNKPAKGNANITLDLEGVVYQFANEANRDKYKAEPNKYKPTYGGWCATAMAKGEKVEIDPTNYKITNGRLFLFYKGFWGNARNDWVKDESAMTVKADAEWKKFSGE